MTYVFVPAYYSYGLRKGPVRAFVVHMAEGGGTVGFLSRPSQRGVSVHYVIEYSGRIVQMLHERQASGSINPNDLRTTEGPYPYGATVRKEVMREWDSDPNSAVISVEIEGFAKDGPNSVQSLALDKLVEDVRSRYSTMGLLGHRDFQDYKACPGSHILWDMLGGHGPAGSGETDVISIYVQTGGPGHFTVKGGTTVRGFRASATGWEVVKTLSPSADSGGHYSGSFAGTASPSSVLAVDTGYFAGLYVSTAEVVDETPDAPAGSTLLLPGTYVVE